jgi:hypothetical protein
VPAVSVPLVDLVLGVALLATIGVAATPRRLDAQAPGQWLGWLLVVVPLPLVVAFRLSQPSSPVGGQTAFVAGVLAFAVGTLLVLSRRDDTDDGHGAEPDPAPWWPEFERDFRAYARQQSRQRAHLATRR